MTHPYSGPPKTFSNKEGPDLTAVIHSSVGKTLPHRVNKPLRTHSKYHNTVTAKERQQRDCNQQYSEHPLYSDGTGFTHKITNKTNSITTPNS